jgi:peptidoglycan/xylan/chitin deacetylase (PgdA/CDA1 family)
VARDSSGTLHVLCLHDVVPEGPESQWDATEDEVHGVIDRYRANGYAIVTLDDLPARAERALAVTVDDARAGAVAWLLHRAPVRTTVFVVPGWMDEPDGIRSRETYGGFGTWEQLAALRDAGHVIGSHTMTHRALPTLPAPEVHEELRESRLRIRERLGVDARHLALPFGRNDETVTALAKEAGYETVCLADGGVNDDRELESGLLSRLVLRRDRPNLGLPHV